MERTMTEAAMDAMAEAVLNPEFQAALDSFEPSLDQIEVVDLLATENMDDPEFAALVDEVEAEADTVVAPVPVPVSDSPSPSIKISPFALLLNPTPAFEAAKRLEALNLPRRVVFLFGKKGITSNPEISRLDQDMDLEADDELEDEEAEEASVQQ